MIKPLCRQDGIHQWNADVVGARDGMMQRMLITVFCDTRRDAIDAVCREAVMRGFAHPTVNHITRIR